MAERANEDIGRDAGIEQSTLPSVAFRSVVPVRHLLPAADRLDGDHGDQAVQRMADAELHPGDPTLDNFTSIFNDPTLPVARWFFNSFFIAAMFTLLVVVVDALAAYAYARMEFRGRRLLFALLLTTLVMPAIMFVIPNYITVAQLGWIGDVPGHHRARPGQRFRRLLPAPVLPEHPARARRSGIRRRRQSMADLLPGSAANLGRRNATLAVITFLVSWNDFLWPLLMTSPVRVMQTLPVGLSTLQGQYTFDYGKLMAGALVLTIPVLLLYVLAQRFIIRSVATTGLKG